VKTFERKRVAIAGALMTTFVSFAVVTSIGVIFMDSITVFIGLVFAGVSIILAVFVDYYDGKVTMVKED
jgi:hypothetical protein